MPWPVVTPFRMRPNLEKLDPVAPALLLRDELAAVYRRERERVIAAHPERALVGSADNETLSAILGLAPSPAVRERVGVRAVAGTRHDGSAVNPTPHPSPVLQTASAQACADRSGGGSHAIRNPAFTPQGERGQITVLREIPVSLSAEWIVDGLFGIGLKRPLDAGYSDAVGAIAAAREAGAKVLALDVPSGIDADTGALVGDAVVVADQTITFLALKPGLLTGPALDYVGELHCDALGVASIGESAVRAIDHNYIAAIRHHQATNTHKGTNGTCVIIGGATGMLGAALLSSRAAMRTGAGKVKVGWLADPAPQVDVLMPEVMMGTAASLLASECSAMVVGCGLGVSGAAVRALKTALKREVPLVVDADALNLIAQSAELATLMQRRATPTIITPHPAEAARLLGCSTADVQRDRLRAARDLANGYRCIAVIKGAGTVVCDGTVTTINRTGNPLLATAGTGDVLAGMIGALLAQGYEAATAARLGVCVHGAAADALAARGVKRAVAGDVIDELRVL